jgi:hypothetical protein
MKKIEFIYRSRVQRPNLSPDERYCDGLENGFRLRDRLVTLTQDGDHVEIQVGQMRVGSITVVDDGVAESIVTGRVAGHGGSAVVLAAVDEYLAKCEPAGAWDVRLPDGTLLPLA